VALRELLDQRIAHERELTLHGFTTRDVALRRQADEYEYRLKILNGHMEHTVRDRKELYSVDKHDDYARSMDHRLEAIWKELSAHGKSLTIIATWGAAGLLLLGIIEFALKYIWR
jgi:hypothetical protein